MDRAHTGADAFDPLDTIDDEIGPTRLQCKCVSRDAYELLRRYLKTVDQKVAELSKMGAPTCNKSAKELQQKVVSALEVVKKAQNEIRASIREHGQFQKAFARQAVDQIKRRGVNVPPNRAPLAILPWKVGVSAHPKPSKVAFLKRNAPSTLPIVESGGIAELDKMSPQDGDKITTE